MIKNEYELIFFQFRVKSGLQCYNEKYLSLPLLQLREFRLAIQKVGDSERRQGKKVALQASRQHQHRGPYRKQNPRPPSKAAWSHFAASRTGSFRHAEQQRHQGAKQRCTYETSSMSACETISRWYGFMGMVSSTRKGRRYTNSVLSGSCRSLWSALRGFRASGRAAAAKEKLIVHAGLNVRHAIFVQVQGIVPSAGATLVTLTRGVRMAGAVRFAMLLNLHLLILLLCGHRHGAHRCIVSSDVLALPGKKQAQERVFTVGGCFARRQPCDGASCIIRTPKKYRRRGLLHASREQRLLPWSLGFRKNVAQDRNWLRPLEAPVHQSLPAIF